MLVVAALAASFAACSLTTNLDGLSGGADVQPEGGTAESGSDSPIADAGDAATSGGDAADGAPVDPCAGAVFCDQFERDAPDGKWQSTYTDHGGMLTIDPTTSTSPSRSLALFVPAAGDPHAQLSSPDYPNVAHARVSWSMKSGAPNRAMSLMRIQIDENNRGAVIDIFMFDGRFVMDENVFGTPSAGYADYNLAGGFKADTWQRWTMELDARGTTAVGIVTLDGVERIHTNLKNTYATGVLKVLAGAFYVPDGVAQTIHYDDIAVTILP
jgi:hypothetical protein